MWNFYIPIKMVFAFFDGIKLDKRKELYLTYVSSAMTTSLDENFKALFVYCQAWNSPCKTDKPPKIFQDF